MSRRVIDYALARDVDVHVEAHGFGDSDHRFVVFDCLRGKLRRLRVGLWNVERDRPAGDVVDQVRQRIVEHRLDAFAIVEASDYAGELRQLARGLGWHYLSGSSRRPGSRETALMVRRDLVDVSTFDLVRLTRSGWITVKGARTAPKYAPVIKLAGWLTVAVVHLPPSVRFYDGRREPAGPVRRVVAYLAGMASVRRLARRRRGPLLIAGDWNATPGAHGPASPAGVADSTGLRIRAPKIGTHR